MIKQGATNVSRKSYEKSQDNILRHAYYDNINSLVTLLTNADVTINFEEARKITDRKIMDDYLFGISKKIYFHSEKASQILEKSISCEMYNLAKLMIEKGANVDATNKEDRYMLELAAQYTYRGRSVCCFAHR